MYKAAEFTEQSRQEFIDRCASALAKASATPVLAQHRDVAGLIAKCILSFLVFPVFVYLACTGQLLSTNSEHQVNKLKANLLFFKEPGTNEREEKPVESNAPSDKSGTSPL